MPDIDDISAYLKFSPQNGHIWLDDRRMLLVHASAIGALRRELIETLGLEKARALLTRMGYASGAQDAELASKIRPNSTSFELFAVGPQLHALEGVVKVETVRLEADVTRGKFYGEFLWHDSWEDEVHISSYGIGAEPACWMQIGYACGYTSGFMGQPILYREVECRAMGHHMCRIVGKPVEEWDDVEEDLRYLQAETFVNRPAIKVALQPGAAPPADGMGENMVGASAAFNVACHMLRKVSETDATVLFLGESGVGKEMFARTLHRIGPRAKAPYIAVNCAAIPEHLVESELFGVERGAFTGATESRAGRFERADGGTLFLDEIATLTLSAQGKLLRVLQEGEVERVGDKTTRKIDVRVVAATNVDLRAAVEAGRFRQDLFYRLNVFPIEIPPLRERKADIPLLINHFLKKFSARHRKPIAGLAERVVEGLLNYHFPGNIRELENMIERGVILAPHDGAIDLCHLFTSGERIDTAILALGKHGALNPSAPVGKDEAGESPPQEDIGGFVDRVLDGAASLEDIETRLLTAAVEKAEGNLAAAARMLGLTRPQLAYRLKKRDERA